MKLMILFPAAHWWMSSNHEVLAQPLLKGHKIGSRFVYRSNVPHLAFDSANVHQLSSKELIISRL